MSVELLAFGAHPDDLELSCGGWIALAEQRNQSVVLVDLTRGELATNGTVELRHQEATAAAKVLGVALRENLDLPDGGLLPSSPEQIAAIVRCIRRHRPTLLLAPWIESRHPDHSAAGALIRRAVFLSGLVRHQPELGEPWRPSRMLHYPQRHEVRPDFVVDISTVIAQKQLAIECYQSQLGPGTATLLNQTASTWEVRDRYWGATIGVHSGEPYVLGSPIPIDDPIAHFSAQTNPPALVPPR